MCLLLMVLKWPSFLELCCRRAMKQNWLAFWNFSVEFLDLPGEGQNSIPIMCLTHIKKYGLIHGTI